MMIEPPPAFRSSGIPCFVTQNTDLRLIAITRSHHCPSLTRRLRLARWFPGRAIRGRTSRFATPVADGPLSSPSLDAIEVAHQLPVGHGLVERLLLEPRGVEVVLDDALAERRARRPRALELGDRLTERLGHLRERRVLVGLALVELRRLELGCDAVDPRRDPRRDIAAGARLTPV